MKSAKRERSIPACTPHVPGPHGVTSLPWGSNMKPGTPPHAQGDLLRASSTTDAPAFASFQKRPAGVHGAGIELLVSDGDSARSVAVLPSTKAADAARIRTGASVW
eukprot:scaffold192360_cov30-Tisochrysis_lutea.AAC.3